MPKDNARGCIVPHFDLEVDLVGKGVCTGPSTPSSTVFDSTPSTVFDSDRADSESFPSSRAASSSASPTRGRVAASADHFTDESEVSLVDRQLSSPAFSPASTWRGEARDSVVNDEHRHLRCLRDWLRSRISHADKVLEELSLEWGSCYLRLAARRLLESSLDAVRSDVLEERVLQQLRDALRDARAAGLEMEDELVVRVETVLQELALQEVADEHIRVLQVAAQEALEMATSSASAVLATAFDAEDIPCLLEAKLQLLDAISAARAAGLETPELRKALQCRRRTHLAIQDLRGVVRVFCRVRPLNGREIANGDAAALRIVDDSTLEIPEVGSFTFDGIFNPGGQEDLFEDCRDLIQSAVDGHNVTIFSYGQTGAGKTYTMTGTPEEEGLVFNAVDELFAILEGLPADATAEASASMCELYNGQIVDLLRPSSGSPGNRGKQNAGLLESASERKVQSKDELRSVLTRGLQRRAVASHATNVVSSRSHLIITMGVSVTDLTTGEATKGKVVLCDLAGSERLKKSASQGVHKKEAIEINKSLAALGNVIEAAACKKKVPYREHKLTQVLQDSIGGTAKTLMIVNCSPAASSISETATSLRYGIRAKRVTNNCQGRSPRPSSRTDSRVLR